MKILIIEDEKPAAQKLIRMLREIDDTVEILETLESIEKATNWLLRSPDPDLVLMDIQLEDGICFEMFDAINIQTPIIFTTAYNEYTLKAFKVNSIDYLLKPINRDDLKNALKKFHEIHRFQIDKNQLNALLKQFRLQTKERFLVKVGEHYNSILTSDIVCFFIQERCSFLLTRTGKRYPIDYSLDRVEQCIDSKHFFRTSRNFVIRFSAIEDIIVYSASRLKVILTKWKEKEDIVVSRERVAEFKKWMDR